MIAFGEWTFGVNSFGWRFSAALIGSLAILLLARIVRRMTRSTLLGCIAGLLMALDGLEFVMSRTALLDIFLMFWCAGHVRLPGRGPGRHPDPPGHGGGQRARWP